MQMHNLTLVFDLDGTLVDTAPDLINAANHVLATLDLAPVAPDKLRPRISLGARVLIETALQLHAVEPSEEDLDRLFDRLLDYYIAHIAVDSRPFDGLTELLRRYERLGTRLCVCTNKREDMTRALLRQLDLIDSFNAIAGRDTFDVFKPHPDHLLRTITMAGGSPDRAIMVGDSQVDIATANAANVPVIGVTFGYSDPPMQHLAPTRQIDHYGQFDEAVQAILDM